MKTEKRFAHDLQVHFLPVQTLLGTFGELLGEFLWQLDALVLSLVVARLLSFGERFGIVLVQHRHVLEVRQIVAQCVDRQQIVVVHVAFLFLLRQTHEVVLLVVLLVQVLFDRLATADRQLVHLLRSRVLVVLVAELLDQRRGRRTLLRLLQALFLLRPSFALQVLVLDRIDLRHDVGARLAGRFRFFVFTGFRSFVGLSVVLIVIVWFSGGERNELVLLAKRLRGELKGAN